MRGQRRFLLGIFVGLILGGVVSSGICWYRNKQKTAYNDLVINQYKNNLKELQEVYRNPQRPSPSPSPLNFVKETNTSNDFYKLDCYDFTTATTSAKPETEWFSALEEKFSDKEKIGYLCDNQELNLIALISQEEVDRGGQGGPPIEVFKLQIYNPQEQTLKVLRESSGSYLGGWCGQVLRWSKKDASVYYRCGGGDGPWAGYSDIKINILTKEAGIIKSCYTMEEKTDCKSYCDSSGGCFAGEFCNLETHTCVKYCKNWSDCPNGGYGSCVAYGPVMGCGGY